MLTQDERVVIEAALASAFAGRGQPRLLVPVIFKVKSDSDAILVRTGSPDPLVLAGLMMDESLRSRWTREPSLLESILEFLVEREGIGDLGPVLSRVKLGVDPNWSVYDSSWLLGDSRPFFDRRDLRSQVRLLIEEDGAPILRVLADGESFGRSYTKRFMRHLERRSAVSVRVLTASISRDAGPSYQVEDLLDELRSQIGDCDQVPARVGSSYPTQAALWLLRQLAASNGFWLLVLDGFGQRPINEQVPAMVEELAYRVSDGHRDRVRLLLLDYPYPLPDVDPQDILEETLPPAASVCKADLLPCLETWDALRRKRGLKAAGPATLTQMAEVIIGEAPAAGRARLERLNAELTKLLRMP